MRSTTTISLCFGIFLWFERSVYRARRLALFVGLSMPKPFSAIPGPKGWPLIGSLLDYTRFGRFSFERMHLAKRANQAVYGKIYKEKVGMSFVQLFDPADIETVYRAEGKFPIRPEIPIITVAAKRDNEPTGMAVMNGEPWWRIRSAVHKTMMPPGAAHVYLPAQNEVADDFIRLLSRKLEEGSGKLDDDITKLLTRYTLEAFGAVCFNVRIGCLDQPALSDSEALRVIRSIDDAFEALQKTMFAFPTYAIYRTKLYRQYIKGMTTVRRIALTYVDKALSGHTTDEVKADGQKGKCPNFLRTLVDSNADRLTNDELAQLAIDLFGAGIDSTAYALGFCLYNLARNGDKQERLISEIDAVLDRTSGQPVTPEVLNQMKYLKACVKESFRLNFPVEGGGVKELTSDLVLSDYLIPKGTNVVLNFQTMCLLEEYFKEADRYLPERWLKGEGDGLRPANNFVMLPFGHGSRMCIGRRFAEQEIWLALIKLFQHFRLQLDVDKSEHIPVGMINRLFTMPDAPLPLQFVPRKSPSDPHPANADEVPHVALA